MKRIYASKAIKGSLLLASTLFFTSCSSLWLHREQTVDSALADGVSPAAPGATVPREQYDEMVRKYQDLLNESKKLKGQETPAAPVAALKPGEQKKPEVAETTVIDPSELVNKIDAAIPDAANLDGVDALKPTQAAGPAVPTSMGVKTVNNTDDIDDQITRLRQAQELIKTNKFENALVILKELESAKEKQIAVRAKMMLGDLLFNQGEYDLSSQVYEEVIGKYAFSGLVIKALGKLVVCSEKLKQPEKQAKYYSLLHDFFEAS